MTAMTMTENRPVTTVESGAWRLNVLGPVELTYDGTPVEVNGPTRTLLALLARSPCEEISTTSIIAGLWGSEPPEDSEKEVASHVSRLRKALTVVAPNVDPTSVVVTMPAGYILAIQPSNADILAFERLAADGRRAISVGQPQLALTRLDAALALWRGRAYEDFGEHAFARAEATRLEELRLAAIESRVDARMALAAPSAPPELVSELQALLADHWHRERLWGQLMTVLFRLGRRSDALAAHRRAQEVLAEGLRVQPGPDLRAVERAVLDSDKALYGTPLRQRGSVPPVLAGTVPACVGRAEEAQWLTGALDLAATRRAQARLVVGSPGTGKTRLMAEVAQRVAQRGVDVRYWRAEANGLDNLVAAADRLTLVIVEDLDQAVHADVERVAAFIRTAVALPVVTIVTCRDPVRVGDLQGVPKLVLSALDDAAVAEIVREYAPTVTDATAASAMVNAGGVPARVHRAASEWAFARAGRRIDRAVADGAEPRRALGALHEEVVAGALELSHVRAKARLLRPTSRTVESPYPGLAGFGSGDTEIFHGREHLVAETLARLAEHPLLALVGGAGTGKSSLVRAGLLPALTAGVLPDSARWRQVVVTPSTVDDLAHLLAEEPTVEVAAEVEADVEAEEETGATASEKAQILLVVDQFEEVFTLLDVGQRIGFVEAVVGAAQRGRVVIALRSEFFTRCGEFPELSAMVTANTVLMPPMAEDELRRAIERPAAAAALRVEPGLVDRLTAEVGDGEVGLAHLATALRTLWEGRTGDILRLHDFQAGPGLAAAVEAHAERVLGRVASAETGRALLLGLCQPSGSGPAVRRRANLTELLTAAGPGGLAALEVLAAGGLVLVDAEADTVELAHDVLLTGWPRLRDWIADETADTGLRRHLAQAASAWAAGGREPGRLYRGARLVTVLDWAERHGSQLSTVERDFLAAANKLVLAAETRRKRRTVLLWKWLAATVLVAILAVAVAVVAVTMQLRAAQNADRADAARIATAAIAEPDPRLAMLLAVAASRLDAGTVGTVRDVLARTGDLMATAGERVVAVQVSPDGRTVAAGEAGGAIRLLDPRTLAVAATLDYPGHGPVTGLAFTSDGRRLVSWGRGEGASIVVWDLASRRPTGSAFGQPWPGGGGLLADHTTLVVAQHASNAPAVAAAWSIDARTPSTAYTLPPTAIDQVLVSPDGRLVVLGGPAGSLVLEPSTGVARTVPAARLPLAVSGHTLLAADGNTVAVWDIDTAQQRVAQGHKGQPLAAAWTADGRRFASAADDGTVIVWDATTLQPVRSFAGGRLALRSVAFGPDGSTLYTAGDDGGLLAWDLTGTRGLASRLGADNAVAVACTLAGRDLTADEWHRFLPDRPVRAVCTA